MKLKILKKLRTASLNSAFTGSYKKQCNSPQSQLCASEVFAFPTLGLGGRMFTCLFTR